MNSFAALVLIASASKECKKAAEFIRKKTGLYLSEGSQYGKAGEGFLRMNAACPKSTLMDGLERLKDGLAAYEQDLNAILR